MHRRTAVTTTASIVGVLVAGTTAVGANLGILSAAGSSELGDLSAASPAAAAVDVAAGAGVESGLGPEVVDVYLDGNGAPVMAAGLAPAAAAAVSQAVGTSTAPGPGYEAFAVDVAGQVTLENYGNRIEIDDVVANPGWTSTSETISPTAVVVTFAGPSTFVFTAELLADGTINAAVNEDVVVEVPVPAPAPSTTVAPAPTAPAPGYYDHDDDEREHERERDDDDHERDHDEHDEHEGRDDDD